MSATEAWSCLVFCKHSTIHHTVPPLIQRPSHFSKTWQDWYLQRGKEIKNKPWNKFLCIFMHTFSYTRQWTGFIVCMFTIHVFRLPNGSSSFPSHTHCYNGSVPTKFNLAHLLSLITLPATGTEHRAEVEWHEHTSTIPSSSALSSAASAFWECHFFSQTEGLCSQ